MFDSPLDAPAWGNLQKMTAPDTRALFESDPERAARYFYRIKGMAVDLSKNAIDDRIMAELVSLARAQKVEEWRERLFSGDIVNITEQRPAFHTALRRPLNDAVHVNNKNIMAGVHGALARMEDFSNKVRRGEWVGYTGKRIKSIVNIGIGGSDLGPHMVTEALKPFAKKGLQVHFVSNVDGAHLAQTLEQCKAETTLFLIASKTFTTQETMMNAQAAREWFLSHAKDNAAIARHFVALSTNIDAAKSFGIPDISIFPFEDWVGGRFSLWSSIGLSICLSIGFANFKKLLRGAHAMDRHFQTAPLKKNIPVLLALIGIWNRNFLRHPAYAVLPYAQNLRLLPAFLQQLDMESNGKSTNRNGKPIEGYDTGPIVFGEAGTNGQHAFYQHIHQGRDIIPCDFIGVKNPLSSLDTHHNILMTHMLAQSQALLQGRDVGEQDDNQHRAFTGNRPSTTIVIDALDPHHLGMLTALYEHKIFVQGIIWNINSFDQYGVELGKELAQAINTGNLSKTNPSTEQLKTYLAL